jgi:anti-sigma regulatory factor (Ser/Thr protein kinase)
MQRHTQQILSLDVPCDSGAPGLVRAALGRMECLGAVVGDVVLVASELVTNAVLHSGCLRDHVLAVRATVCADRMTISVHDRGLSERSALPRVDTSGAGGGWGLRIVEQLAARWGSQGDDGYRVWAEVALPSSS